MFKTHDDDMIGMPGMFGQGQYQWLQVSRLLRTYWYHVTLQAEYEGRILETVLMIDGEPRLQQILIAQDAETFITEVQVVTPAYMNGTTGWRMEPVTKVMLGKDRSGCVVSVVEVESGAVYQSSHQPGFQVDSLSELYPVFLVGMIRPTDSNSEVL
jgi:hypothetical protein